MERLSTVPIARLNPNLESAAVRGVVTVIWPYSASKQEFGLILAEQDFRLRRSNGQVHLVFRGHSAKAIADFGIGIGDGLRIALDGAKWLQDTAQDVTPGRRIGWKLQYSRRLLLAITRDDTPSILLDIDRASPTPQPLDASQITIPIETKEKSANDDGNRAFTSSLPADDQYLAQFLLDDDSDSPIPRKGSKRARFGRRSSEWRFAEHARSPINGSPSLNRTSIAESPVFRESHQSCEVRTTPKDHYNQREDDGDMRISSPNQSSTSSRTEKPRYSNSHSQGAKTLKAADYSEPDTGQLSSQKHPGVPDIAGDLLTLDSYESRSGFDPASFSTHGSASLDADIQQQILLLGDPHLSKQQPKGSTDSISYHSDADNLGGEGFNSNVIAVQQAIVSSPTAVPRAYSTPAEALYIRDEFTKPVDADRARSNDPSRHPSHLASHVNVPQVQTGSQFTAWYTPDETPAQPIEIIDLSSDTTETESKQSSLPRVAYGGPYNESGKLSKQSPSLDDEVHGKYLDTDYKQSNRDDDDDPSEDSVSFRSDERSSLRDSREGVESSEDEENPIVPQPALNRKGRTQLDGSSIPRQGKNELLIDDSRSEVSSSQSTDPSEEEKTTGDNGYIHISQRSKYWVMLPENDLDRIQQESSEDRNDKNPAMSLLSPELSVVREAVIPDLQRAQQLETPAATQLGNQKGSLILSEDDNAISETNVAQLEFRQKGNMDLKARGEFDQLIVNHQPDVDTCKSASALARMAQAEIKKRSSKSRITEFESQALAMNQSDLTTSTKLSSNTAALSASPLNRFFGGTSLEIQAGFRTSLSYFASLATLAQYYNSAVDVFAVVISTSDIQRANKGPRDHFISMYVTDPRIVTESPPYILTQVFRRSREALPQCHSGDVVLLRNFKVQSRRQRPMLLSCESSAWAVFVDEAGNAFVANGPPVEAGQEEWSLAKGFREWWRSLDEEVHSKTMNNIDQGYGNAAAKPSKGKDDYTRC